MGIAGEWLRGEEQLLFRNGGGVRIPNTRVRSREETHWGFLVTNLVEKGREQDSTPSTGLLA